MMGRLSWAWPTRGLAAAFCLLVPGTFVLSAALGEARIPVDAALFAAAICLARRPGVRGVLAVLYFSFVGLFILNSFNVRLNSFYFYADFVGSIPPPQPIVQLAVLVAIGFMLVVVRGFSQATAWDAVFALIIFLAMMGVRVTGVHANLRHLFPLPSLTVLGNVYKYLKAPPADDLTRKASAAHAPQAAPEAALLPSIRKYRPDQIYINVMESWMDSRSGLAGLEEVAKTAFGARLKHTGSGYKPWSGGTLNGELRELCGLVDPVTRIRDVPTDDCLPNVLAAQGYETIAAHGYKGMFYLRSLLYPRLGFKKTYFLEDVQASVPVCAGAFRGACDLDLFKHVLQHDGSKHRLVYLMSLQSHEPVPDVLMQGLVQKAEGETRAVLVARAYIIGVIRHLAAQPDLGCTARVYFVGDHPPPSIVNAGLEGAAPAVSYLQLDLAATDDRLCKE